MAQQLSCSLQYVITKKIIQVAVGEPSFPVFFSAVFTLHTSHLPHMSISNHFQFILLYSGAWRPHFLPVITYHG